MKNGSHLILRQNNRLILSCVLAIGVVSYAVEHPTNGHAENQDERLKEKFLTEAPRAWQEYAQRAAHVQGKLSWSTVVEKDTAQYEGEYKTKGTSWLMIEQSLDNKNSEGKVTAVNSKYAFQLKRTSRTAPWVLTDFRDTKHDTDSVIERWELTYRRMPLIPVSIGDELLLDAVKKPHFRITRVGQAASGNGHVEILFDYPNPFDRDHPSKFNPIQGGLMILDSQRFWTVRTMELRLKSLSGTGTQKVTVELRESPSKIPTLRRKTWNDAWLVSGNRRMDMSGFTECEFAEPDPLPSDEEFILSEFGLPEPIGVEWQKPTPVYVWILIGAGVLLMAAIGMRFLARRQKLARTP